MPTSLSVSDVPWLRGALDQPAVFDEASGACSWADLRDRVEEFGDRLGAQRSLILLRTDNSLASVIAYLAGITYRHVVMLLPADDEPFAERVEQAFSPDWICQTENKEPALRAGPGRSGTLHPDLSLMLTTSGSTGEVKFVRLAYEAIWANALSIAQYLALTEHDRGLLNLPLHYSYGLSILNSHLVAGASILLTGRSVTEPPLWDFFRNHGGTNFSGVPHTYDLLEKVGFDRLELPTLRFFTQAGGRLAPERVRRFGQSAQQRGCKFYVMYGQTEATARIAYLPPDHVMSSADCIGLAIPGGKLRLLSETGEWIDTNREEGELVYEGPNVMLGYARSSEDLARGRDISHLRTGDLAYREPSGFFRITGRRSRFLKLFGNRISLDEVEQAMRLVGYEVVCAGDDSVLVALTKTPSADAQIQRAIAEKCRLPSNVIYVHSVDEFPRTPAGKINYHEVTRWASKLRSAGTREESTTPAAVGKSGQAAQLLDVYARVFPEQIVRPDSSFVSLGGDSLTFIDVALGIEAVLGGVPENWQYLSIEDLTQQRARQGWWREIDATVYLRCLAMVSVVCDHFVTTSVGGAMHLLLTVTGVNFVRFHVAKNGGGLNVHDVLKTIGRMAIPTWLMIVALQFKSGKYDTFQLLLLGNWRDPTRFAFGYWFVELLVQVLFLVWLILLVPACRRWIKERTFQCSLIGLAVAGVMAWLGREIWNTDYLYNRLPHIYLWAFFLGWVIEAADTRQRKNLALLLTLAVPLVLIPRNHEAIGWPPNSLVWSWLGGLALLSTWKLPVLVPFHRVVYSIAGASLFIFLLHHTVRGWVDRIIAPPQPWLHVVAGLVGGVAGWWVWQWGGRLSQYVARRPSGKTPGTSTEKEWTV